MRCFFKVNMSARGYALPTHCTTQYIAFESLIALPVLCFEGSCLHVYVFLYSASLDEGSSSASALSGQVPICVMHSYTQSHKHACIVCSNACITSFCHTW